MRIGSLVLVIWLLIGAAAAFQRGYFEDKGDCAKVSTIAVTVIAGPLNYLGVNPKVDCPALDVGVDVEVPQPSK